MRIQMASGRMFQRNIKAKNGRTAIKTCKQPAGLVFFHIAASQNRTASVLPRENLLPSAYKPLKKVHLISTS